MRSNFLLLLAALACAALVLSACGGGSSDKDAEGNKVNKTTLELGESAKLTGASEKTGYDVSYTVDAKEGKIEDLKDFNLEKDEQDMTPWYVTETAKNEGGEISSKKNPYGVSPDVLDDGGVEAKQITLLGDFKACELVAPPDPFPAGDSYTTCHVYLVPKGSTLGKVVIEETKFEGDNNEFTWKVS